MTEQPNSGAESQAGDEAPMPWNPEEDELWRSMDGRLARVHLRAGLISLARAELERMAARDELDQEAAGDLAEARWRSGDLVGSGEAAAAHLSAGGDDLIPSIVAAEALYANGQAVDAREIAERVLPRARASLDQLFAGEPRSSLWPAEGQGTARRPPAEPPAWGLLVGGRELYDPSLDEFVEGPQEREAEADPAELDPIESEFESVRHAVETGRLEYLPERLALLMRADEGSTMTVLSLANRALAQLDGRDLRRPAFQIIVADTLRALGREDEAIATYQTASSLLADVAIDGDAPNLTLPLTVPPPTRERP